MGNYVIRRIIYIKTQEPHGGCGRCIVNKLCQAFRKSCPPSQVGSGE